VETRADRPVVVGVDASDSARAAAGWAADLAAAWAAPLHLVHAVPDGSPEVGSAPPAWLVELTDGARRAGAAASRTEVAAGAPADVLAQRAPQAGMLVLGSYGDGAIAGMLAGHVALALAGNVPCPVAVVRGAGPEAPPPRRGPVVAGVDGSATARAAGLLAADLAARADTELVLVLAWTEVVDADGRLRRRVDEVGHEREAGERLAAEARAVGGAHPGLDVRTELVHDTPLRALLHRAPDARLLVVGHRGHRPARGLGLGSTSRALVEFAPCPVVVTPPVPDGAGPS